jgi:multidrug resistance efflux pump
LRNGLIRTKSLWLSSGDNAQTQLAAAQAALEELNLVAPFAGEIITLNLKVGEVANPGVPGVVLADLSHWVVETTDLTEIDVSQISPGMEAEITVNAFPDRTFTGVVKEVDRQGVESRGTVTYAVRLDLDPGEAMLYWGMSAFVEFLIPY